MVNKVSSQIITISNDEKNILRTKTKPVDNWEEVKEIVEKLFKNIEPYCPAAGLAAPQIGIDKQVFIYSYDRQLKNLEVVINPSFIPLDDEKQKAWEGCFSVVLSDTPKLANVGRYNKIQVTYLNREKKKVTKILEGFAAKVFQHEYDHLQGILNIDKSETKEFKNKEELSDFMNEMKTKDADNYIQPKDVE